MMKHQKSEDDFESLTPSSLLDLTDLSHGDFSLEMSNAEHLNAEHLFPIDEDDVSWLENYALPDYLTSDQSNASLQHLDTSDKSLNALGVASSPLLGSEVLQPLSEINEETLDVDFNAALISDTELFQKWDEKPKEGQQIYPSADLQPEVPGSLVRLENFPNFPNYVFPHPTPAWPVLAPSFNPHCPTPMESNTIQNYPHFIHIPQLTHFPTIHQLNFNYHPLIRLVKPNCTCLMHLPNLSYPLHPPHLNVSFSPHPPAPMYPNTAVHQPMNAVRHPEAIQTPNSSQAFNTSFPHDVHQNFRLWQRFCETAQGFYSSTPDVEALACFFIDVIGFLTPHRSDLLFDTVMNVAIQEWNKTSTSEREKYYTAAKQFIELREQERRNTSADLKTKLGYKTSDRTDKPRGGVVQYSSGKEEITGVCQDLPAHDLIERALKVMDDLGSEVTVGHQVNTEACVQHLNEVFNQNEFITEDLRIQKASQVSITPPASTNSLLQENDQHQDHRYHNDFQILSTFPSSFSVSSDQRDLRDHSSSIRDDVQSAPHEISLDVQSNSQSVCFSLQTHKRQATNLLTMKHCLGEHNYASKKNDGHKNTRVQEKPERSKRVGNYKHHYKTRMNHSDVDLNILTARPRTRKQTFSTKTRHDVKEKNKKPNKQQRIRNNQQVMMTTREDRRFKTHKAQKKKLQRRNTQTERKKNI